MRKHILQERANKPTLVLTCRETQSIKKCFQHTKYSDLLTFFLISLGIYTTVSYFSNLAHQGNEILSSWEFKRMYKKNYKVMNEELLRGPPDEPLSFSFHHLSWDKVTIMLIWNYEVKNLSSECNQQEKSWAHAEMWSMTTEKASRWAWLNWSSMQPCLVQHCGSTVPISWDWQETPALSGTLQPSTYFFFVKM